MGIILFNMIETLEHKASDENRFPSPNGDYFI